MEPQSRYSLIQWHKVLDSTNNEAKRVFGTLDNMSVIAALYQTAGRGRGSHSWVSASGENLTFSLVLKFREGVLPSSEAVRITHLATVSVSDLLVEEGVEPRIKWPNDVWVGEKKISGMLIENSFSGASVTGSVIGIGLNLNQKEFDPLLPNPTSLSLLTGRSYNPVATLDRLYEIFCRRAPMLEGDDGRARLELEFSKRMFVLEKAGQDRISDAIDSFEAQK